jgi:hypothetical protein
MTSPPDDPRRAPADPEAAEIEREMTMLRRYAPPAAESRLAVRRLILTLVTTALVALALWTAMR